ncbi:MAG: hypothetical protein ONB44_12195 [candidate division KSB1 bacterium]|nr:hypothetical protein [candidate division KSB1 bacterium]MDZ7302881.1 hypothetical protein [candidate division KSB1 bacterium]MDZ7310457.1 hypothetical protein [candidate division KSB1 bacterium]
MREIFSKILGGVFTALSTLVLVATIPPGCTVFTILLYQGQAGTLASSTVVAEIVSAKVDENTPGPVAKVSDDLISSCLNRILTHTRLIIDCAVFLDDNEVVAEIDNYQRHNNLHFNIPLITYRQPVSEHSSEG